MLQWTVLIKMDGIEGDVTGQFQHRFRKTPKKGRRIYIKWGLEDSRIHSGNYKIVEVKKCPKEVTVVPVRVR